MQQLPERRKNEHYPAEVRETAYELWAFECDRNASRTSRRLAEVLEDTAIPHPVTIAYWARTQGWDLRADQAIASIAPNLRARQLGRLFVMGNQALETFSQVLNGELDTDRTAPLQAKVVVSTKVLELLGLGTAAGKGEAPKLAVVAEQREDLESLSPQELARLQREALLERRRKA